MGVKFSNTVPFLFAIMLVQASHAHSIWVAERADQYAVVLGEGGMDNRYDSDKIADVVALDANNHTKKVTLKPTEHNMLLDFEAGAGLVAVTYDAAYFTKDKAGDWHHKDKTQVADSAESTKYTLITKTLLAHQKSPIFLPNLPLQITALEDPLNLNKGDVLPVKVTFMGKALADAEVVVDFINDPRGAKVKTNGHGVANIPLASHAINVLQVSHKAARKDTSKADFDGYGATLAFDLSNHGH